MNIHLLNNSFISIQP